MSKVSIELDLKVVQEAIHAKVKPAVDSILATVDIPALIEAELLRKPDKSERGMWPFLMVGSEPRRPIDEMISSAMREAAQAFVKKAVEHDTPKIEAAFARMVEKSQNSLAQAMVKAMIDGMGEDWEFELSTKVSPTVPSRDY